MLRYDTTVYFSMTLSLITGSYLNEICKDVWPNCHQTLLVEKNMCNNKTDFSRNCKKSCGVCSDKCSCPCRGKAGIEHRQPLNLTKNMIIENIKHTKQVMAVDKTKLSSYRRTKMSTSDDRKSAKSIGQLGAVILIVIVIGIVLLDFCPRYADSNKVDVLKPKKKELCV
ncbi:unnamed protein product [Mytilus coruscus]|uniref:ShKT domain-containing protein n=1 Tax=Mytilus coruscus TaxID=42192 RepID=A0A6J8AS05_MYTCO|nr:unnamed protein product [Mytilus coruscus]